MREFLADTLPMVIFSTIGAMLIEIFISRMTFSQSLRARLIAIPINTMTARPYGLFRDWFFRVMKASESGPVKKTICDISAFMIFQVPLYGAILLSAGANIRQIITSSGTTIIFSLFAGRPYGIILEFSRKIFRAKKEE